VHRAVGIRAIWEINRNGSGLHRTSCSLLSRCKADPSSYRVSAQFLPLKLRHNRTFTPIATPRPTSRRWFALCPSASHVHSVLGVTGEIEAHVKEQLFNSGADTAMALHLARPTTIVGIAGGSRARRPATRATALLRVSRPCGQGSVWPRHPSSQHSCGSTMSALSTTSYRVLPPSFLQTAMYMFIFA